MASLLSSSKGRSSIIRLRLLIRVFLTFTGKRRWQAVGPDFPIIFRLSSWKLTDYEAKLAASPEELERFLIPLAEAGVDIFDTSTHRFWEPEFEGSDLNLAGWVRQLTSKPVITVGSVGLDSDFASLFAEGKGGQLPAWIASSGAWSAGSSILLPPVARCCPIRHGLSKFATAARMSCCRSRSRRSIR
jgi:hypothetical protein